MSAALVIQHAKRMRCIILSSFACLVVPYFSKISHKWHNFQGGGGVIERRMRVLISSTTLPEIFLIVRRIQRDTITNVQRSSCKVPVIIVTF